MKELVYGQLFLPAVDRWADRECVVDGDHRATFAAHATRVLRLASAMASELGLGPSDRFAVLSPNTHCVMELIHAGYLGAGVITPLNTRLSAAELAAILADSGARVLFVDGRMAALAGPLVSRGLDRVVLIGPRSDLSGLDYEDLLASGNESLPPEPGEGDLAALVYTGGTTGAPRGVMRSQRAEMLYMYHTSMSGGVATRPGGTFLHQAPMFHATALISALSAPVFGVRSAVIAGFEPAACMEAVERWRATETVLVPTMMQMLFEHPEFSPERLGSLRYVGYGAMAMPPALLDRLRRQLPAVDLIQGFGMTEAGVLTCLLPEDHDRPELLRSVGRAVPGVILSIRDLSGRPLPARQAGEVWARGGNLFDGYWGDETATAAALEGGWYRTGDVGWMDEEGYLFLEDRLKDMIVTGGENVYSVEVERVIAAHPEVAQVAVIGVPDERWGERVHAVVVPRHGCTVTPDDIISHARGSLAGFKVPKSVELRVDGLPMSAAMKPLKRQLRLEYRAT